MSLLQAARDGTDANVSRWTNSLEARCPSIRNVVYEIIGQLTTGGGSLIDESCKDSMAQPYPPPPH
jgi:hypothetical protein